VKTVLLLLASNLFMTTAWYWHLKAKDGVLPLVGIILISWLIALPEYALAVPANRLGAVELGGPFTAPQLKILQEGIALLVFIVFSLVYLKASLRWQDLAGMGMILGGLAVALWPRAQAVAGP
jgi:uncharacterized protein (DUF486 family)